MSASRPQRVRYELDLFAREGGETHRNRDGWGILFAQDRDAYIFREPDPAASSRLASFVVQHEQPCRHLMAHVRRATAGGPELANTHPFDRVENGQRHAFAHNGELPGIEKREDTQGLLTERIGDTDSELAFLLLLQRLRQAGTHDPASRFQVFSRFADEMRELGSANFLFFDGDRLFVHADRRRFETATGLSERREPGLNIRIFDSSHQGHHWQSRGATIPDISGPLLLFASVPLDPEGWQPLARGEALMLGNGEIEARRQG